MTIMQMILNLGLPVLNVLALSFYDYTEYFWHETDKTAKAQYRGVQAYVGILHLVISYLIGGLNPVVGTIILHEGWCPDFMYYFWCSLEVFKEHPGEGSFTRDAISGITWAAWTPLGVFKWFFGKEMKFTDIELVAQAIAMILLFITVAYLGLV